MQSTKNSHDDNTKKYYMREEKLNEIKRKQKRQRILRRLISILLTVPWFIGLLWTALHPLVSVVTGELKCRGQYIDENGLDVHRHRVESYPLQRVLKPKLKHIIDDDDDDEHQPLSGMCNAINSMRLPISPSVECLHHDATKSIAFDIVRILPPLGPMIESEEAIVIIVGGDDDNKKQQQSDVNNIHKSGEGDWYDRSDMNASILYLIKKLGSKEDCPWLTKTVFIVSPTTADPAPAFGDTVDAFMTSYLGDSQSTYNSQYAKGTAVRPLPPDFTYPMIRSVLVLNDVDDETTNQSTPINNNGRTEVRILPQGTGGALPNLDLVFATYISFQSYPKGDRYNRERSIYYNGESEFRTHPFGAALDDKMVEKIVHFGSIVGLNSSAVTKYAKDLAGLFGFVAAMAIGPRQPHASALNHGIDALTIEVRIPSPKQPSSTIHPHYADLTRCIEHLLRSISNLHERLHHSIAQYTMPSPSKFVSHGEYIYPAILTTLPMVVRAATLALRDLRRFQFVYVGMVLGSVCVATTIISLWTISGTYSRTADGNSTIHWSTIVVFSVSYLLVFSAARQNKTMIEYGVHSIDKQAKQNEVSHPDECQDSLRFVACLVGIYIHAPLLLANYSIGFPSSVFWTPLLATLVLPRSLREFIPKKKVLATFIMMVKVLLLLVTSPPLLLIPTIGSSMYVLGVYIPLHLLLASLWLS